MLHGKRDLWPKPQAQQAYFDDLSPLSDEVNSFAVSAVQEHRCDKIIALCWYRNKSESMTLQNSKIFQGTLHPNSEQAGICNGCECATKRACIVGNECVQCKERIADG